ncbi:hypothetical protein P7K49_027890 [Saguinus oedipus]|uniref:Uncharacterized protein n=1 Tax=Saguinus oedipus TaxID=9490 RepID=A0ABQ9UAS0_SAGOE|nr:hypothetical protein P7K49_027890 [Saguinus oedipus]
MSMLTGVLCVPPMPRHRHHPVRCVVSEPQRLQPCDSRPVTQGKRQTLRLPACDSWSPGMKSTWRHHGQRGGGRKRGGVENRRRFREVV